MAGRGKPGRKTRNGPLNGISSTLSNDWKSVQRSYQDFKSGSSLTDSLERGMRRMGRGSFFRGAMKSGGYMAGGAMLLDWLFD